uniref:Nitric oxide synthase n=1 Tax=Salmo trutta TaxID=8032 RepID=A0A674CZC3_SALTR
MQNQPCTSKVCEGSVMTPKALLRGPKDATLEILPQAIDLINQYYKSFKIPKIEHHLARLEEITMEIDSTGTYQLTIEELAFGARQAWRNAPRCIGRIQWSNLQLFDARKCKTTQDMFQFLCEHLQFATNGGNLRSAITVFPQRKEDGHDFRVWNSQLLKYAGYQMPDGSIQGDPSSVEFTKICIQLGWKPQYGLFDVLPLVLQVNGEDPDLYEIPPHLILEVSMEHPQHKWFQDLGLKWYALPAVSNMLMEIGGLEFPACPFNGWYMGTEIGVRDFCDYQRYNILEEVGRRMGLETHKLSSLWKDQALVTINVAVIYSFQKNKVTITDHHSAAESFMKHLETEFRLRGGCPADWAWLVPPMSGSLTPVFHQEMVNYILSPFFYYQVDTETPSCIATKRPKITLKEAALFSSTLMSKVLANRVRCTVLYATETGKSQTLAQRLNSMLNCAFNSRLLCMEDYNFSDMEQESLLVVVTSTFGNGDSPGNGEGSEYFPKAPYISLRCTHLMKLQLDYSFRDISLVLKLVLSPLSSPRYCVFGLGSRMYPQFCAFAHAVDAKLEELGAERVTPTGEGDELNGQEEAFSSWALTALKSCISVSQLYVMIFIVLSFTALSAIHSKTVFPMKLKSKHNLQSPHSSRSTILVELEMERSAEVMNFAPGDHVGVFPGNLPQLVAGILKFLPQPKTRLRKISAIKIALHFYFPKDDEKNWQTVGRIPACPLSQALTYFLDVTTPPCQNLLHKLSQLAKQDGHRQRLLTLAKDSKEYTTWKMFRVPNFLEVLEEFPSLEPSAAFLLSQLPLLKPRLYSISSSPQLHPNELHLTLTVLNYHTQDGQGPLHHGVCSTWLDTIKKGDLVPCFIYSSGGFHLPAEPSTPVILVGAGSGIAPFRSFWQHRLHDMKHPGSLCACLPMSLVFGCQSSETDHLYKEETLEMRRRGVLKSVTSAYSRQPGHPKVYVQDVLRERMAEEVLNVLHQKEGHFYVCGGVNMAQGVTLAVQEILSNQLGITLTQAGEYLAQLKIQKRYHEDIFGTGLCRGTDLGKGPKGPPSFLNGRSWEPPILWPPG